MLLLFPAILLGMVYLFLFFTANYSQSPDVNGTFLRVIPFVLIGTAIWFAIAWLMNTSMIRMATGSKPLERRENKRVYNLLENLCISRGMKMPKLNIIEDDSMNAFASGISESSFTISLSRGIINRMDDDELEGVIAHELSHIRNRDVRLMIISIIFVGIFAFVAEMAFRSLRFGSVSRNRNGKSNLPVILIALAIAAISYLIAILLRFAISRSREYMADAGAAELTRKPYALASALRKIVSDPYIEAVNNRDVAQLFIENPAHEEKKDFSWGSLFATHPPIEKRIELLEQFA